MEEERDCTLLVLVVVWCVVSFVAWGWNAVKLTSCDFEPNYKCEFIHGAGLVAPPLSILTVWFGDDEV